MQNAKKSSLPNKGEKEKRLLRDYARYSNLAFQLIGIILAAFFIGWQIDKWVSIGFPLFTLIFSIIGIILSLYVLLKDL
jgi:F0F1-type ATP synthase assembly protein I